MATFSFFHQIIDEQANNYYQIPKFQRQYVWDKEKWEMLINDIDENERDYFVGSIITVIVNNNNNLGPRIHHVVDGQQRLITLTLIVKALLNKLQKLKKEMQQVRLNLILDNFTNMTPQEQLDQMSKIIPQEIIIEENTLFNYLFKVNSNNNPNFISFTFNNDDRQYNLVLTPSIYKSNLEDYTYIMSNSQTNRPQNFGNRRLSQAFTFIENYFNTKDLQYILDYIGKVTNLKFVHISAKDYTEAYQMFSSINSKGLPLTAIDIIKNYIISQIEAELRNANLHVSAIDAAVNNAADNLDIIQSNLKEDSNYDRFLRHFYNSLSLYKGLRGNNNNPNTLTKSRVINIYSEIITRIGSYAQFQNSQNFLDYLLKMSKIYSNLIDPDSIENKDYSILKENLIELNYVQASTSYSILMFLLQLEDRYFERKEKINTINIFLEFLIKYYIRRNITDIPGTKNLDRLHVNIVEKIIDTINKNHLLNSNLLIELYINNDIEYSSLLELKNRLNSPEIYKDNINMSRYLLYLINKITQQQNAPQLYTKRKDNFIWTIEHILPQQRNGISVEWTTMLTKNNNSDDVNEIKERILHKLGNLTLSPYNSQLSDHPFIHKRDLADTIDLENNVRMPKGYKNGLGLNTLNFRINEIEYNLANIEYWDENTVNARQEVMVRLLLDNLKFDGEKTNF